MGQGSMGVGSHREAGRGPALAPPGPGQWEWNRTWKLGFQTGPGGVILLLRVGDGVAPWQGRGLSWPLFQGHAFFPFPSFPCLFLLLILSFSFPSLYFYNV